MATKVKQGDGDISFLVSGLLMKDVQVTIIKSFKCNQSIWLRIKIVTGIDLHVGCVCMSLKVILSIYVRIV